MFIADFHIHSRFSRATSQKINVPNIALAAKQKGLDLVGTGDFSHPKWFDELKTFLKPSEYEGFYEYDGVLFVLSLEINTVYEKDGKERKVHHVIFVPDFDVAEAVNQILSKYGPLDLDGRPTLRVESPRLVEELMENEGVFIFPAHAWTPWFGVLGSKSGFDSLEECYEDQVKHIHALETGLSSDPAMNWRVSSLDKFTLLSCSDAHSLSGYRLGREANVFKGAMDYKTMIRAIKNKDKDKFLFTVEVDPAYGKYHFDGHRKCNVRFHPKDAIQRKNICPVCRKPLTIGVLHRVEELADRKEGFIPKDAIPFKTLLPLQELISHFFNAPLTSKKVEEVYHSFLSLGPEYYVLLKAGEDELKRIDKELAPIILANRMGKIDVDPGYDGVYGIPKINKGSQRRFVNQTMLKDFF